MYVILIVSYPHFCTFVNRSLRVNHFKKKVDIHIYIQYYIIQYNTILHKVILCNSMSYKLYIHVP